MKKFNIQFIAASAVLSLSASAAFSATHVTKVTMDCPDISVHTKDQLTHYGTYIAGTGTERVNSDAATYPLFQGSVLAGANIPVDLKAAGYDGDGVTYNPITGSVICKFASSLGYDSFAVSYTMTNALHGTEVSSGDEQIKIRLPVGLMAQ